MVIKLRKIKRECFDELENSVIDNFLEKNTLEFPIEQIECLSQSIIVDGKEVEVDIDIEKYLNIAKEDGFGYSKFAKTGMALHKDLKSDIVDLPRNLFYEKEFWAYLSMTYFSEVIRLLRLKNDDKITANKIKQFYFNSGSADRTGLLFLWLMVDRLNSEDDFEMTNTAFEFVDPVKAILERTMSKNPDILKAFVQGIINNGKDPKFKSDKYRSKVPSNISCYASVNMLDALTYDELVDVVTKQQKMIIS